MNKNVFLGTPASDGLIHNIYFPIHVLKVFYNKAVNGKPIGKYSEAFYTMMRYNFAHIIYKAEVENWEEWEKLGHERLGYDLHFLCPIRDFDSTPKEKFYECFTKNSILAYYKQIPTDEYFAKLYNLWKEYVKKSGGVVPPCCRLNEIVWHNFLYKLESKKEIEMVSLIGFTALTSILGSSTAKVVKWQFLLSRMCGNVKMVALEDMPDMIRRYNTRRKRESLINYLVEHWNVQYKFVGRGAWFMVGTHSVTLEEFIANRYIRSPNDGSG